MSQGAKPLPSLARLEAAIQDHTNA